MPSDAFALEEGREAHILRYFRLGNQTRAQVLRLPDDKFADLRYISDRPQRLDMDV